MKRILPVFIFTLVLACVVMPAQAAQDECYELINGGPDAVVVPCPPDDATTRKIRKVDSDNDGVPDIHDNCPGISNADQSNTWGSELGNACDPNYLFSMLNGTSLTVYPMLNGTYDLYGDCFINPFGDLHCQHIATVDACVLPDTAGYSVFVPNPSAPYSDQQALVTLVSITDDTYSYQVNIMDSNAITVGGPVTIRFHAIELSLFCGGPLPDSALEGVLMPTIPLTDSFEDHRQYLEEIDALVESESLTAAEMIYIQHMLNTWSFKVETASSLVTSLKDTYEAIIQKMP